MALKHLILARLLRGPAHGYEMHHEPLQPLHPDFGVTEAHIYASLRSLEKDGYVRHRRSRRRPFPDRLRYAITPKGRVYLRRWALESEEISEAPFVRSLWDPMATRLFVAAHLRRSRSQWPTAPTSIAAYRALLKSKSLARRSPLRSLILAGLELEKARLAWFRSIQRVGRGKPQKARRSRRTTSKAST